MTLGEGEEGQTKEKVLVAGSWSFDRKEVGEELWEMGMRRK